MSEKNNQFESLEIEFEQLFKLIFSSHKLTSISTSYEDHNQEELQED